MTAPACACEVAAKPALPPPAWDGEKMFAEYAEKGCTVPTPGPEGRVEAYVAIDPQCPKSMALFRAAKPLADRLCVRWLPIAAVNFNSDPQSTMILMSEDPWKKLNEHVDHFGDEAFRGLPVDQKEVWKLPQEVRMKVWANSKLARWNGTRGLPLGVVKTRSGEYRALTAGMSTGDIAAASGL